MGYVRFYTGWVLNEFNRTLKQMCQAKAKCDTNNVFNMSKNFHAITLNVLITR